MIQYLHLLERPALQEHLGQGYFRGTKGGRIRAIYWILSDVTQCSQNMRLLILTYVIHLFVLL